MTGRLLSGLVLLAGALIAAIFFAGASTTEETFLPVIVLTEASESRPQQISPSERAPAPAAAPMADVVAPSTPIGRDTAAFNSAPEDNTAGVAEADDSFEGENADDSFEGENDDYDDS